MKFTVESGRLTVYVPAVDAIGQTNAPLVRELIVLALIERGDSSASWALGPKETTARYATWHSSDDDAQAHAELVYEYAVGALAKATRESLAFSRQLLVLSRTGGLRDALKHDHEHDADRPETGPWPDGA